MGLRLRLFFVLIIPLTLLVGVYAFVRVREEEGQLLAAEQRNASVTARAIQIAVENAVRDRQIADIRRLLSELVNRQEQIERIADLRRGDIDPRRILHQQAELDRSARRHGAGGLR